MCPILDACDVNVSPDKRTIFLHSEDNLVSALKVSIYFSDPYQAICLAHVTELAAAIM